MVTPTPARPPVSDAGWRTVTDKPTKIRFRVSSKPMTSRRALKTSDGLPIQQRQYQTFTDGHVLTNVTVTSGKNVVFDKLQALPKGLVLRLKKQGRSKVVIFDKKAGRLLGKPSLSFRVKFATKVGDPPIWYYSAIARGSALVVIQTVDFPDRGTSKVRLPRDLRLHKLLIGNLKL